jgi:hypothetical protein
MQSHIDELQPFVTCNEHFAMYVAIIAEHYIPFKSRKQVSQHKDALNEYTECHHIMPRSLGGADVLSNIVVLPGRKHLESHYHLYKATQSREMIFAFNQMRRYIKNDKSFHEFDEEVCQWYEEARSDISNAISVAMRESYQNCSEEEKKRRANVTSNMMKGKVPVIFIETGESTSISVDDYDPKIHRYHTTGTKKSEETKQVMRQKASPDYRGFPHYNVKTKEIRYFKLDEVFDSDWVRGTGLKNTHTKNTIFYHNPETKEQIRCVEGTEPDGWVRGRCKFNNPFKNPVIMHLVTKQVILQETDMPFYAGARCSAVYLYNSPNHGYIVTYQMEFMTADLDLDRGTILNHLDNPQTVMKRKKKDCSFDFFGKNVAAETEMVRIPKEELTLEMCDEILKKYTWVKM